MDNHTLEIFALGFVACFATLPWALYNVRKAREAIRRARGWRE